MKPLMSIARAAALAAAAALSLSSCNLLFLKIWYEEEPPKFDTLAVNFNLWENTPLWPTADITIHDDTGIKSVSCVVQTGEGETKSFTFTRTNERERYKWSCPQDLGYLVSAGLNTLTFTATDLAGNTVVEDEELYLSSDVDLNNLKGRIDFTKTPREALLWHVSGISSVTYHYYDDWLSVASSEYGLTNIDDGTGGGGDKLFRGQLVDPSADDDRIVFTVTINGSPIELSLFLSE